MKRRIFTLLAAFLTSAFLPLAGQDAHALLREVNAKFARVKNYTADVRIKADIPFVRMMPVDAKVWFQQPDQFRIKSKGIALLPRQGFDQLFKDLRDTSAYMPVIQGIESLRNRPVTVVNILPLSDTADLILGKLWVNPEQDLIMKSQVTSRSNGTVTADYYFGKQAAYALPDSMTFTIDTRKFKIPKAVAADLNNTGSGKSKDKPDRQKGMIQLSFSNYRVNNSVFGKE